MSKLLVEIHRASLINAYQGVKIFPHTARTEAPSSHKQGSLSLKRRIPLSETRPRHPLSQRGEAPPSDPGLRAISDGFLQAWGVPRH